MVSDMIESGEKIKNRGRGKMFNSKLEAFEAAEEAKKLMKFGKWEIHLWENLGWHYSLNSCTGYLKIYPAYSKGMFHTSLSEDPDGVGTPTDLCTRKIYSDPNKAVLAQISILGDVLRNRTNLLKTITEIIKT